MSAVGPTNAHYYARFQKKCDPNGDLPLCTAEQIVGAEKSSEAYASVVDPLIEAGLACMTADGLRVTMPSELRGVDLSGKDLRGIDFSFVDLSGTNFNGADLRGANFRRTRLFETSFRGADLEEADFRNVISFRADFGSSNFSNVSAYSSVFAQASFRTRKFMRYWSARLFKRKVLGMVLPSTARKLDDYEVSSTANF